MLLQNHWINFNKTWHKASLGEGDSNTNNDHSILNKEIMGFFSLNQCYGIIMALCICVYWFELFLGWGMLPMGLLFLYFKVFKLWNMHIIFGALWNVYKDCTDCKSEAEVAFSSYYISLLVEQ